MEQRRIQGGAPASSRTGEGERGAPAVRRRGWALEREQRGGGGGGAMGSQGHGPSAAGDGEEIPPEAEHERAGKNSTGRSGRKKIGTERTRAQR
jgi:hypothetical protein